MDITSVGELEACIGVAGTPVKMKIIDHLDAGAQAWIAASPVAFVGLAGSAGPRVRLAGGEPGFARAKDASTLRLPLEALDSPGELEAGQGAGVLFLVPGVGETLRANGRVAAADDGSLEIRIEECFVHCAKALIRSDFWSARPLQAPDAPEAFVGASRFLALATMDAEGRIDISPKGDPAGLLVRLDGERLILAERPGNRLAFGYRNMIAQDKVAALALVPGCAAAVHLTGRARLTTDEALREAFVVEGKTPVLATVIEGVQAQAAPSPALARAGLWGAAPPAAPIDAAATLVGHLKLNKDRGITQTLVRLATNRGLVAKGLEVNYREDLY